MKLTNKQYDVAKQVVTVVIPALITLISGLGVALNYDTAVITTIIGLFAAFAGTVLGISSKNYQQDNRE
ncbi:MULTISPECIES: phage holin [unclassified Streptococcus]|uniref:phage holin n=1 Tax=unclassified Streptococcus TaxID=2608887 RepID=UPI00211AF1E4|nr:MULTISPECIES: phage holin [unclassified Streptococcus]MCQ9211806.1 phage holin [Streptococcus sp. B01]MCQ9212837.1 phage holin [Streptococcus sp. B01]MCQ9212926.1 phage holin [Streptococcus sp. O1]MCQ9215002.1 phage holin [Streptococcus sp. O1]